MHSDVVKVFVYIKDDLQCSEDICVANRQHCSLVMLNYETQITRSN